MWKKKFEKKNLPIRIVFARPILPSLTQENTNAEM